MDTPDQVEAVAAVLRRAFDVVEESGQYPNCGASRMVRRYIDLRLRAETPPADVGENAVAAVEQLRAEVEATLGDHLADRTYALESVERQLTALLGTIADAGGG